MNELYKTIPIETFEFKVVVSGVATMKDGDIIEALDIVHVNEKIALKARRLIKKRWKVFEKVEGFNYAVELFHSTPENYDPIMKKRYNNWKEVNQIKLANLEEIF